LDLNLSQWFIVFFILNKGKKILEESVWRLHFANQNILIFCFSLSTLRISLFLKFKPSFHKIKHFLLWLVLHLLYCGIALIFL
jgi:hypothetical protein